MRFVGKGYATETSHMEVAEPGLVPPVPTATQTHGLRASGTPMSSCNPAGAAAHTAVPHHKSSSGCNTDPVLPQTFKNGNDWKLLILGPQEYQHRAKGRPRVKHYIMWTGPAWSSSVDVTLFIQFGFGAKFSTLWTHFYLKV